MKDYFSTKILYFLPIFFCPLKNEHTFLCESVIRVNCARKKIKEERIFAPLFIYNPFFEAS